MATIQVTTHASHVHIFAWFENSSIFNMVLIAQINKKVSTTHLKLLAKHRSNISFMIKFLQVKKFDAFFRKIKERFKEETLYKFLSYPTFSSFFNNCKLTVL